MAAKSTAKVKDSQKSAEKTGKAAVAKNATSGGGAGKVKPVAEIRDGAVYILQAGTKVYVKTADVCAMTGKSNQWIGQLASQGVLNKVQTPHGNLYEIHDAVKSYLSGIEEKEESTKKSNKQLETDKLDAEVKLKKSKAAIAVLDAKERAGKMHRSEDVAAMTEDLIYTIRGALLALPGRLAVDVVEAATTAEASEIIRAEVYRLMEELAGYQYDPGKYQERVRERLKLEKLAGEDE